jgi:hypothetical protein
MASRWLRGWLVITGLVLVLPRPVPAQVSAAPGVSLRAIRFAPSWNASPATASGDSVVPTASTDPQITFFGVTRADDTPVDPIGNTADDIPIYLRLSGFGFSLVVEGKPGTPAVPLGTSSYSSDDVNQLPDLQVEVSQPLGDGSVAVCDDTNPDFGGVPAVNPFDFSPAEAPAVNDLACRFKDGQGQPVARNSTYPCTRFPPELEYHLVDPTSTVQFCGEIAKPLSFQVGDTIVAARIRDIDGNVSAAAQLIIRVATPVFTATATRTATPTPTSTATPRTRNFADSDGCTMASPRSDIRNVAIFGLLPLALVCWRRRRGRKRARLLAEQRRGNGG